MAADGTILIESVHYDLEGLERLAWTLLASGVGQGRDAFHIGTLCTVCDNNRPHSRSMVLRGVDAKHQLLATHTDARATKAASVARNPHASWVFYNPVRRLQVRVAGIASLHRGGDSAIARSEWGTLRVSARTGYCSPHASSSVRPAPSAGLPDGFDARTFSLADSEAGFDNFAVLLTRVTELEVLYLNHAGHRRARVCYDDADTVRRDWLAP